MLNNYTCAIPVPVECSARYAGGWSYADWYVSQGGSPDADSPDGWSDEKYAGWWARLAEARRVQDQAQLYSSGGQ